MLRVRFSFYGWKDKNMTSWKNFTNPGHNAHNRIKYTSLCFKGLSQSLPKKSYTFLSYTVYDPYQTKNKKSGSGGKRISNRLTIAQNPPRAMVIQEAFVSVFPLESRIQVKCAFCGETLKYTLDNPPYFFAQPQSRNRMTPVCEACRQMENR